MESVHIDILNDVVAELIYMGYKAQSVTVNKNNTVKRGIIIKHFDDDVNFAVPIVYEEDFAVGNNICEMAKEVVAIDNLYRSYSSDFKNLKIDKNYILQNAYLGVCRLDWNEKMLEGIVHKKVGESDLAMFVRCEVFEHSTFKVGVPHLQAYGLSFEELFEAALNNDNYICMSMKDLICEQMNLMDIECLDDTKMFVISNEDKLCGAGAICDNYILKETLEKLGSERMLIIPSSIHEIICVPDDGEITTALRTAEMITEINAQCLRPEEVLSDHPYIFDGEVVRNS